ncbi:alpha-L-rhamnosidase-related protein [Nitrolancea hollandica]|uniref:Alpha-L-rhamnosidase n=1 Tax=Nitrolancea hollandica Lb TaxID=1129897 RepID=I4EHP0_9BACT|nr:alpha-L-rhamnosidase C-terminal domain-containing protein [Nitrolancea hollandica]CCF84202.1 conserved exported hypothetical protein [Nitrolancea hollandica Lb]
MSIRRLLAAAFVVVTGIVTPLAGNVPLAGGVDLCSSALARYVLAPPTRQVLPVSIEQVQENGGRVEQAEGLLARGGEAARIERTPGSDPTIVVDFGQNVSGLLTISTSGSTSPELRVAVSESRAFLGKDSDLSWEDHHTYAWRPPAEASQFQTGQMTFRYVLLFLTSDGRVDIDSLQLDFTPRLGTPDTYAGCFESNDELLNRIWYAGAYTLDLDTTDPERSNGSSRILDGAKRDRAVWSGDLALEARIAYVTHGHAEPVRDSLADLADHQRPDGAIPPTSLGDYRPVLYDYCAWWVQAFADYYRYTGDRAFIERYYPHLQRQMAWFLKITDTNGLLARDPRVEQSVEWMWTIPRPGEVTYLNAVYYQALLDAADLASRLGHSQDAATWRDRATWLKQAMNDRLFDPKRGVYISHNGDRHVPQDANVLPILYGIAPQTSWDGMLHYLKEHLWTPYGSTTVDLPYGTGSYHDKRIWPFMGYYELEARFKASDDAGAFDLLRREWGQMVREDPASTMWEWMTADGRVENGYVSLAHAWSAGATASLTQHVLGVRPTEPGYTRFDVIPHTGDLAWAKGRVPTPLGPIEVSWERTARDFTETLSVPAGAQARAGIPISGTGVTISVNGEPVWSDNKVRSNGAQTDGRYVYLDLAPGTYTIDAGVPNERHLAAAGDRLWEALARLGVWG